MVEVREGDVALRRVGWTGSVSGGGMTEVEVVGGTTGELRSGLTGVTG